MTGFIQIGPFELGGRIGRGGIGTVYRARHTDTGDRAAVKVWQREAVESPKKRRTFRRELQALAKLYHPAIASILDYGRVGNAAATRGPDDLVEGAPWFAMEYVDGRPVHHVSREWTWEDLESFLFTTLDALAHAHARSILHRDLKPSNILVTPTDEGGEYRAKLVDFGVARILHPDRSDASMDHRMLVGTPQYMAPEQITGSWRDQGPWTDLYALGCLTWKLVTGTEPFRGDSVPEIFRAHLENDPPEFEPNRSVPEGLEAWLRRLLRTDIDRRSRRAADAAWELYGIDSTRRVSPTVGSVHETDSEAAPYHVRPTLGGWEETLEDATPTLVESGDYRSSPDASESTRDDSAPTLGGPDTANLPPIPADWQRGDDESAPPVPTAGLELFALREVPLVDRNWERDRLWRELYDVQRHGNPRVITLEAGPGTGKTRLAQWLCERAHEVGAATILRAEHSTSATPEEGLTEMMRRTFRTHGLERGAVFERLLERLPSSEADDSMRLVDARALTEYLRPTGEDDTEIDGPEYRFSSPGQTFALLHRVLHRLAARRPLLLWLDDLQWGDRSVAFLEHLVSESGPLPPTLIVATIRFDILGQRPGLEERLEQLWDEFDASRIALSALSLDDHRALIDRLLRLDPELADALAERTEGHPLFAVQLLRAWVDRGRLVPTSRGYQLEDAAEHELPNDIHQLWLGRLEELVRTVDEQSTPVWRALERAATLGRALGDLEWSGICRPLQIGAPRALKHVLVERGLADHIAGGWRFAHRLLVESLRRRARERDRLANHHRHCARLLGQLDPEHPRQSAARRADHWEKAGELDRAVDALREEYERLQSVGPTDRKKEVLERREQLLDSIDAPRTDPRRIENDLHCASVANQLGQSAERQLEAVRESRQRAEVHGDPELVATAWTLTAQCHSRIGEYEEARHSAERAVEAARECPAENRGRVLADALIASGWLELWSGSARRAKRQFREAQKRAEADDLRLYRLNAERGFAWTVLEHGDFDRAEELFEELLERSRVHGYRWLECLSLNALGERARFAERIETARSCYTRARKLAEELGRYEAVAMGSLNLAQVELCAENFEAAGDALYDAEQRLRETGRMERRRDVWRTARLAHAAGTADWDAFDRMSAAYRDGWPEDSRQIKDHPWLLEMAGDYAAERHRDRRARRAWRLARSLWEELDNPEGMRRVDDKLNRNRADDDRD